MERRFAVHAGAYRQALIVALVLAAAPVAAMPKSPEAKLFFERGVTAYKKGDYQTASDLLTRSAAIESDPETLFALAQTHRKLDHCDYAIPLYERLLVMDMPAENKTKVTKLLAECKQILGVKPDEPPQADEPKPVKEAKEPKDAKDAKETKPPEVKPARPIAQAEQPREPEPRHDLESEPHRPEQPHGRSWWQDPVGDTFLGAGLVGLGVGVTFMLSASSADADKSHATTYADFKSASDRASTDGTIGVAGLAGGGALVVLSIVWYATHRDHSSTPVTGWVTPNGGGFALGGSF